MSWDPFQREVLAELGHTLYQAGAPSAGVAAAADEAVLARLARAAAVAPEDLQRHADIMAAIPALQGDARAKRALWPRLRALRRG